MTGLAPRCGKAMRLVEAAWGALPEGLRCGRPAGHNGPCRSPQALAKAAGYERRTWPARRERRRPANAVLAAEIRRARTAAGVSQRALARRLGVSQRDLWAWENAARRVPARVAAALERVLGAAA